MDADGRVTTWNAGAERIKGYRADEIVGQHIEVFYPEEDCRAGRPAKNLALVREHGRHEDEGWRVRKDGTCFWANAILTALRDEDGEVVGFAKVTRDLTELRAADESLRRIRGALPAARGGHLGLRDYMLDPEGRVTTWNPGAEKLHGYTAAEIVGQSFFKFFPEDEVNAGKPARELEVAREMGRNEDEGWRVRKDGTFFWAFVVLSALRGPDGELIGFAKITRDLTLRRQAEMTARELHREQVARATAEESNREKDEFLAVVSHELRAPLTAILGWATMLRADPNHPSAAKAIAAIDRNARAQAKLIEDLIDVSRIITGKMSLDVERLSLDAAIKEVLETLRPAAYQKGIELAFHAPAVESWMIGDSHRLRQVFTNLVSNALKFTPASGSITVAIHERGSAAVVTVRDTGVGIAPALLPHVFERFRQGDASTTRRAGGLGLGLAIVKHLVELHGGSVTAASDGADRGSTFAVTLPLHAMATGGDVASVAPPLLAGGARLTGVRVLVVDDDEDARELVKALLGAEGAEIDTAASSAEGFQAFERRRPDVLVSDIGMPGEDGYSFMARIRSVEVEARVPSLALTAYARPEDRRKALSAGFTGHVGKPVDPEVLVTAIGDLVRHARKSAS